MESHTGYVTLESKEGLRALVNRRNGQLVSAVWRGKEYVHGGGKEPADATSTDRLGWLNSEICMFPIVGPLTGFTTAVAGTTATLDQHGVVRLLPVSLTQPNPAEVRVLAQYQANTLLENPRVAKDPSAPPQLCWPLSFSLEKTHAVQANTVSSTICITNLSDTPLPYEFGWHPALLWTPAANSILLHTASGKQIVSPDEVFIASQQAAYYAEAHACTVTHGEATVHVKWNLPKVALWSPPNAPFLCVEPVTDFADGKLSGSQVIPANGTVSFTITITCE